jgi:hypothetical protein
MAGALGLRGVRRIGHGVDIQKVYLGGAGIVGRSSGIGAVLGLCANDTEANELPILGRLNRSQDVCFREPDHLDQKGSQAGDATADNKERYGAHLGDVATLLWLACLARTGRRSTGLL